MTQQPPFGPATAAARTWVPAPRAAGPLPDRLAGFTVLSELGRGARSTVYAVAGGREGRPASIGGDGAGEERQYALKITDPLRGDEAAAALNAFRREAALLATVDHPHLPRIHEVGEEGGRPYLLMDRVVGTSLARRLAAGPMSAPDVVRVALDLVSPLVALHARGLVHRDIKPENVMILPGGEARLIDFGLAARGAEKERAGAVGTLLYCPPEQSGTLKRPVDDRSDLYALGAVLHECLTGRPPFRSGDVGELLRMHAVSAPPDLRGLVPGLPEALSVIVDRLLAKDPDDRYPSAHTLGGALAAVADDLGMPRPPDVRPPQDARPELVGRSEELASLVACWDSARRGAGGMVIVRGGGGGGKSRLAEELAGQARRQGALVLQGKSSADQSLPLDSVRAALDSLAGSLAELAPEPRAARIESLRSPVGEAAWLLPVVSPALLNLLEIPAPQPATVSDRPDALTLALADLFSRLARDGGPVLLVLDDVQWLDRSGVELLAQLAVDLRALPMLVLVTARDDAESLPATDEVAESCAAAVTLDLTLGPLDAAGISALVRSHLPGQSLGEELPRILEARAGGNPFILTEYLRATVDAGLLHPSWGGWKLDVAGLDRLQLPGDAVGLVLARVNGLDARTRSVLVTAATIGARFPAELVAAVCDLPVAEVLAVLAEAHERRLVEPRGHPGPGSEFAFVHDRIREALLDSRGEAEGQAVHLAIAVALGTMTVHAGHEAERLYALAHHFAKGGPAADPPQVVQACLDAARQAVADHAPAQALDWLGHAVDLQPDQDADFRFLFGTALTMDGSFAEAVDQLEAAVSAEPDPYRRALILTRLADVHRSTWNTDAARDAVDRGLAELGARPPRNPLLLALGTLGMLAAASLMQWTRIGFGRARGIGRRRCELVAGLHEVGSYVGVLTMALPTVLMHNMRAVYWVNRVGSGPQYARSQGTFGFMTAAAKLPRISRRAFARALADPAATAPATRALLEYYHEAATYIGLGRGDGDGWLDVVRRHGVWLDTAAYCDALSSVLLSAAAEGRVDSVQAMIDLGEQRQALRAGEITSMITASAIAHAISGRPAAAGVAIRDVNHRIAGLAPRALRLLTVVGRLFVLREQREVGADLESALADFAELGLVAGQVHRPARLAYLLIAWMRIEQARSASPQERPGRVRAARAAVSQLHRASVTAAERDRHAVALAELQELEGDPRAALASLHRLDPSGHPDDPTLAFEAARIRARAWTALGAAGEARRQAGLAFDIAEQEGWPHRARWVVEEFGVETLNRGSSVHRVHGMAASTTVGASVDRLRLQALQQVSAAATSVLDPVELARIALDETLKILTADRALLFLTGADGRDQGRPVPQLGRTAGGQDVAELTGYSATVVETVLASGAPLVMTGTEQGTVLGSESVVLHDLRSVLAAPLSVDGRVLGVVYLDSQVARGIFSADDAEILTALTHHIATSLQTARAAQLEISVQAAQHQRDLADLLRRSQEYTSAPLDPDAVTARMLQTVRSLSGADGAWLLARSAPGVAGPALACATGADALTWTAAASAPGAGSEGPGLERDAIPGGGSGDLQRLLSVDGAVTGRSLDPRLTEVTGPVASWAALPLRDHDHDLGTLLLIAASDETAVGDQLSLVAAVVGQSLTAHEKARLFSRVRAQAVTDELTGVSNRRCFFELAETLLQDATAVGRPVTAVMVDIDHFKRINDTHGHGAGDDVIHTVARRLAATIRAGDVLARYGGEEFALLISGDPGQQPEGLRAAIADHQVTTRTGPIEVTVSVGATRVLPDDTVEDVMGRADAALYRSKDSGRNRVTIA